MVEVEVEALSTIEAVVEEPLLCAVVAAGCIEEGGGGGGGVGGGAPSKLRVAKVGGQPSAINSSIGHQATTKLS